MSRKMPSGNCFTERPITYVPVIILYLSAIRETPLGGCNENREQIVDFVGTYYLTHGKTL